MPEPVRRRRRRRVSAVQRVARLQRSPAVRHAFFVALMVAVSATLAYCACASGPSIASLYED